LHETGEATSAEQDGGRGYTVVSIMGVFFLVLAVAVAPAVAASPLDDAIRLQREGKNREAQRALRELMPGLRAANDLAGLASALAAATDASLALGEYESAIREAQEAFDVHSRLGKQADAAWDLNAIGLANLYLARYDSALAHYTRALQLDRAGGDGDGEITRLNNIGNVHYMRGRYADALRFYEEAMAAVDTRTSEGSRARLRKMTIANLAVLQQRLGADERALDWYGRLKAGETMQPSEEAQLLINQGWLVRRLGDPVRALQIYAQAQALFARARHRDGEIGAWRNIGIVHALDLNEYPGALRAFDAALRLARESSNRRGIAQALLYRGETLRRMGRLEEAARDLDTALADATEVGLVEEQWKALYGLGRVAGSQGRTEDARRSYVKAIAAIESVRADLQAIALKSEFLADKRDVYDALIALRVGDRSATPAELFDLIEQSRARAWQDRLQPSARRIALRDVQPHIAPGALLLEYWSTASASAALWISRTASGIVSQAASAHDIARVQRLSDAVSREGDEWRPASVAAGNLLLAGLPDLTGVTRMLVVPDGPLHHLPFETLTIPNTSTLVVERFDVSYLPSAAFLVHRTAESRRTWKWPWERMLVAFGDPPVPTAAPDGAALPRLSHADGEIRGIAGAVPGQSVLYTGAGAQKRFVHQAASSAPLLHFSTHAVGDARDPERSRILLAPPGPDAPADYLFLREIYDLDLTGVQLVTLAACDTERGKVVRGEGVEGFSRALLAAGAATAITTKWDVVDQAGAEFMKQFYFALAGGQPEASALRQAKLQFLRSRLAWSHPRYWAGYVLSGDGRERLPRVVSWSALVGGLLLCVLAVAGLSHWVSASIGKRGATVQAPSSQSTPNTSMGSDEVTRTYVPGEGSTPSSSSDSSSARR
jgi:tetratricopeptide (TPR) repeat protein